VRAGSERTEVDGRNFSSIRLQWPGSPPCWPEYGLEERAGLLVLAREVAPAGGRLPGVNGRGVARPCSVRSVGGSWTSMGQGEHHVTVARGSEHIGLLDRYAVWRRGRSRSQGSSAIARGAARAREPARRRTQRGRESTPSPTRSRRSGRHLKDGEPEELEGERRRLRMRSS